MKNTRTSKSTKVSKEEQEAREILQGSDLRGPVQMGFDEDGAFITKDELKQFALKTIEDPAAKYKVYYCIDALLKKSLPSGPKNKALRRMVRDEMLGFLNAGKLKNEMGVRGADCRTNYLHYHEVALETVIDWSVSRGTPVGLYRMFYDLNTKHKFGHQAEVGVARVFLESESEEATQ